MVKNSKTEVEVFYLIIGDLTDRSLVGRLTTPAADAGSLGVGLFATHSLSKIIVLNQLHAVAVEVGNDGFTNWDAGNKSNDRNGSQLPHAVSNSGAGVAPG